MIRAGKKELLAAAAILFAMPSLAAACERPLELDSEQVRHHIDLLKSADADELEQIDVLGALMCAEKLSVRDLAARTALASPNTSIRAETLFEILMQKQGILIEFVPEEGLANEVRDFIEEKVAIRYDFRYVDRNASCISLHNKKDCDGYSLDISGINVELSHANNLGSFSLNDDGDLFGYFKPVNMSVKVPAKIQLL